VVQKAYLHDMWCFHALQCPQAFNSSSVEVSLRRTACSSFDSRDNNCGDPLWFRPSPVPAFSMDPMCGAVHPTSRCYIAAWQPCRADRVLVFGPCDNKPNTSKMESVSLGFVKTCRLPDAEHRQAFQNSLCKLATIARESGPCSCQLL
jgi:hypothetical protein